MWDLWIYTLREFDHDNRSCGARHMWTRTWQGSIQGGSLARATGVALLAKAFLLANNLLTLFSIYWLEDAALNQPSAEEEPKRLIDFVRVVISFPKVLEFYINVTWLCLLSKFRCWLQTVLAVSSLCKALNHHSCFKKKWGKKHSYAKTAETRPH